MRRKPGAPGSRRDNIHFTPGGLFHGRFLKVIWMEQYDLIIHCGACMFNRRLVLSRLAAAKEAGVPITNYGVFLAKMAGILDQVTLPSR